MRIAATAIMIGLLSSVLLADTVLLHDGREYEGEVLSPPNAPVVKIRLPLGTIELRASEVREIRLGRAAKPDPAPKTTDPTPVESRPDPAIQAKFIETQKTADQAATGGEGLAVWQQFLKEHPEGSYAELARQKMAVWKERAAGDLVRFGPQWLPRADVQARQGRADELARKAGSATTPEEAAKLFDQAAAELPYQVDIPLKKAMLLHKWNNTKEYGRALGDVLRVDPDSVVARNNLGVLQARQKQWSAAIANIGKAAMLADDERLLDNLDQLHAIAPSSARAEAERMIQQIVAQLHQAGKYRGQTRWGEQWVSEADCQRYQKENSDIDRRLSAGRGRLDTLKGQYVKLLEKQEEYERIQRNAAEVRLRMDKKGEVEIVRDTATLERATEELKKIDRSQKQIEDEAQKIRDEMAKADGLRNVPPHTGKLVMLAMDSSELEAIQVGPAVSEETGDKKGDDKKGDKKGDGKKGDDRTGDKKGEEKKGGDKPERKSTRIFEFD